MNIDEIMQYCLSKPKAYIDFPFGDVPICFKLNKKIFAQVYPDPQDYKITLKCDMDTGEFYRGVYPGIVIRGYHCPPVQQPYWNTIYIDRIPKEELLDMIDLAYDQVLKSFSKKIQKELMIINDEQ